MRKFFALSVLCVLTACGGGGSAVPSPHNDTAIPVPAPTASGASLSSNTVTPTFQLRIPVSNAAIKRKPQFVSPSTQSVTITLTTENGVPLTTPISATQNISAGTCNTGCTVSGPASPPGSDGYTFTTFNQPNAGGSALDTATQTITLVQGNATSYSVTLLGIPVSFAIENVPSATADAPLSTTIGGPANSGIQVIAYHASGSAISGTYAYPVTVIDADAQGDGSFVRTSACPTTYPTGDPATSATSVVLTTDTSAANFCYGGIAEALVPLSATSGAPGAQQQNTAFAPTLSEPIVISASPANVAFINDSNANAAVELTTTSGTGSTGTVTYAEAGWTDAPYNQVLGAFPNQACTAGTDPKSFSNYGMASAAYTASGTAVTISLVASPVEGACPVLISDNLIGNPSDIEIVLLDTSYTTASLGINGRTRRR